MNPPNTTGHVPVMLPRTVDLLEPALAAPGAVYVDCTLGLGGHAEAVLTRCPQARLIGLDRDPQAIEAATRRLAPFSSTGPSTGPDRVTIVQAVYHELPDVLAELGTPRVQAVLLDLGLSSLQIDRTERGFAYATDSPLDMRMDGSGEPSRGGSLTAAEVLNTYSLEDLISILRRFGEEKHAVRIARAIVAERQRTPFTTSARLVEVISAAIPAAARYSGSHPAKRTFQALRIEVNHELDSLAAVLPAAIDALALGGRIAVLAYHSLEDRMVKQALRAASDTRAPRDLPVIPPGLAPELALLTRGAEKPDQTEISDNPRAASARLRAATRIKEHP